MARIVIENVIIQDPPLARFLFSNTHMAPVWLVLRLWLGYEWVSAALTKIGNPRWVQTGEAVKGFWTRGLAPPPPGERPEIEVGWYRDFIQYLVDSQAYIWFGKLVAYGELLVGIALLVGAFVGVAAFLGAFMNWNYIMAGSASINGLMLVAAILLILAWKTAGYLGLDYWLLRLVGRRRRILALEYGQPRRPAAAVREPLGERAVPHGPS